jgi:hypothetical protein
MNTDALITFATAMFANLNPIGSVASFAGMVADRSAADRRRHARCGREGPVARACRGAGRIETVAFQRPAFGEFNQ